MLLLYYWEHDKWGQATFWLNASNIQWSLNNDKQAVMD